MFTFTATISFDTVSKFVQVYLSLKKSNYRFTVKIRLQPAFQLTILYSLTGNKYLCKRSLLTHWEVEKQIIV